MPCTIDCDPKKYPHCTPECKCDFIYPAVQRFCNPPPLPLFLQTCRMWYTFCPKYKQYHYASQFIYSKSEKGKVNRKWSSHKISLNIRIKSSPFFKHSAEQTSTLRTVQKLAQRRRHWLANKDCTSETRPEGISWNMSQMSISSRDALSLFSLFV